MHHVIQESNLRYITNLVEKDHVVFIDSKVKDFFFKTLESPKIIVVNEPELQKNLAGYQELAYRVLDLKITRNDKILVVGGGALSDLVGFVAATTLRGIKYDIIPTTLLSMIDASIGGKTGINTPHGKNQLGAFYFAENIYLCSEFLSTLPAVQINSGLGEFSKYALLSENIYNSLGEQNFLALILKCAEFKQKVVTSDPLEKGERIILNLGHTLGHAFELMENLPHGIAVAKGIMAILNLYSPTLLPAYQKILEDLKIQLELPVGELAQLEKFITMDKKKSTYDKITLVIPEKIGHIKMREISISSLMDDIGKNEYFRNFQ